MKASRSFRTPAPRAISVATTASGAVSGLPASKGGAGAYSSWSWQLCAASTPQSSAMIVRAKSMPAVTPPAVTSFPLRRYPAATGLTPARAVERLRVEAARRLLAESATPVKRVAERCSFGSDETMRRAFLRLIAVSPQDYRDRFGPGRRAIA